MSKDSSFFTIVALFFGGKQKKLEMKFTLSMALSSVLHNLEKLSAKPYTNRAPILFRLSFGLSLSFDLLIIGLENRQTIRKFYFSRAFLNYMSRNFPRHIRWTIYCSHAFRRWYIFGISTINATKLLINEMCYYISTNRCKRNNI